MLTFAENNLRDPDQNRLFIYAHADDDPLTRLLEERDFVPLPEKIDDTSILDVTKHEIPESPVLPKGFHIQSMADDNNLEKRCKAFGTGFNHPDPLEWPSLIAYETLQNAPDYHKDQDIVVVSPNGEFASFCLIWHDEPNQLAILEPVGTQPEFRRMGLAREAVYEAIRRVAVKGVEKVIVGSNQQFYKSIGFTPLEPRICFQKSYI